MLPMLGKPNDPLARPNDPDSPPSTDPRLFRPHDSAKKLTRKDTLDERRSSKPKIIGGFKLDNKSQGRKEAEMVNPIPLVNPSANSLKQGLMRVHSPDEIARQIKLIQRKIKMCQRKIEEDKKQKALEAQRRDNPVIDQFQINFQQMLKRSQQIEEPNKNFDYLTNPGKIGQQEQEPFIAPEQPEPVPPEKEFSISEGIEKLQQSHENSEKRKFERREIFPHQACKRKTPKLYITQKSNALSKYGRPQNDEEHRFRIYTKEVTPLEIYPTIPNFNVVKDSLSKNIVAYLGQYKPFLDKTREKGKPKPREDSAQGDKGEKEEKGEKVDSKQPQILIFD